MSAEDARNIDKAGKKEWWARRRRLDKQMDQTLCAIQNDIFGNSGSSEACVDMIGSHPVQESMPNAIAPPSDQLLQKRDLDADLDELCDSLAALKVTELKAKLKVVLLFFVLVSMVPCAHVTVQHGCRSCTGTWM